VRVIRSQTCLQRVRPAKLLKPRRDLTVVQVWTIAATGADDLVYVVVPALDRAVPDAGRLLPQDRRTAVAGLAGGRICRNVLRYHAEPPVKAIALARDEDGDGL
jgi:hypothetical protein